MFGPGDKVRVIGRIEVVPRIPCVRTRLSKVTPGGTRDKLEVGDRLGMCQEKRKLEGFM